MRKSQNVESSVMKIVGIACFIMVLWSLGSACLIAGDKVIKLGQARNAEIEELLK